MMLNLKHLRCFIAVAEEGHITRAAERLGMQQPPLSQKIKAIERDLDVQLFRRKPRGVELTDAGRTFLENARATLAQLDHTFERTRRTARGEQGRLCVGVTPTSPFHPFVPRVIRAFRNSHPLVAVTLEENFTNELIQLLRSEKIDVAFVRSPVADSEGLTINPLLKEPLVVALPSSHTLARSKGGRDAPLSLKALADETFIIQGRQYGLGLYDATIAACRSAGFSPRLGPESSRLASTLNLVAIGLGISVVPASLQHMQMDGIAYRRLEGPHRPVAPLNIASRRSEQSAVVRLFLKLIKESVKESWGDLAKA